jgi:hypothetical protein
MYILCVCVHGWVLISADNESHEVVALFKFTLFKALIICKIWQFVPVRWKWREKF